jgi:hypothetical protein
MNNYENLRSSAGTANSKYFLDNSYDYLPKRSSQDYGRNTNYTYGSGSYGANQYGSGVDSYLPNKWKSDYKSQYDNSTSDSNSYLKPKKLDIRDLRNTTNVLPSYFADRSSNDFLSPRREVEKDYYDRKGARTFYDGPSSAITSSKNTSPLGLDSRDKAKYLSPSKYDNVGSSTEARSPSHYTSGSSNTKYESKTKRIQELFDKVNKFQTQTNQLAATSSTPLSPTSPTSPR